MYYETGFDVEKSHFHPTTRITFQWKNGSKFSHFLTVRAEGADPSPPPYSPPNRKISVFFYDFPKSLDSFFWVRKEWNQQHKSRRTVKGLFFMTIKSSNVSGVCVITGFGDAVTFDDLIVRNVLKR